jgi:hypothetical membrane protein
LTSRRTFWLRLAGICGIISPLLIFSLIFLAINSYESFNWELNALSDLGVILGNTADFFNYGLVAGGLLSLIFAVGLFLILDKKKLGRISLYFFILTCCFLITIGLFPENMKPIHYIVSVAFFLLLPISLFLISSSFYFDRQLFWAFFTVLIAIIVAIPWILNFSTSFFRAVSIPETISGLAVSIWTIILGLKMIVDSAKTPVK